MFVKSWNALFAVLLLWYHAFFSRLCGNYIYIETLPSCVLGPWYSIYIRRSPTVILILDSALAMWSTRLTGLAWHLHSIFADPTELQTCETLISQTHPCNNKRQLSTIVQNSGWSIVNTMWSYLFLHNKPFKNMRFC